MYTRYVHAHIGLYNNNDSVHVFLSLPLSPPSLVLFYFFLFYSISFFLPPFVAPLLPSQPPSINNTSIDTLLVAADLSSDKKPPSQDLQDKVHFLFNNVSSSTLQQKVSIYLIIV